MTDSSLTSVIDNLSVGDRVRWTNGKIYAVDRIPTGQQTQIRLMEIDGNDVVHCSPQMLTRMYIGKEVSFPNRPMDKQNIELRLADATPQERFDYRYRKAVARELNTIVKGTSRAMQMEIIGELTASYARQAAKKDLLAPKMPSYSRMKFWQRENNKNRLTHKSKLLVVDHRKLPRKKRLAEEYRDLMESVIRDLHNSRANTSYQHEYEELRLRCQELHPDKTPAQVDRIMPHYSTYVQAVKRHDAYQSSKARQSPSQHRKSSSHGGVIEDPATVGEVMQIDSTKINVFVKIDGMNSGIRPWLTVLIDEHSRVITGWYVSLSPPSSVAVVNAILMSSTEHVSAKRVMPAMLKCDNGPENRNNTVMTLGSDMGFDVQFGPAAYPNNQAHVESNFSSMESRLFHLMGGTTFGKLGQNRPYAAEKHPVYSLDQLRVRITEYLEIYNAMPHSGLDCMTPNQKWDIATADPLHQPETITKEFSQSLGLIEIDAMINDGAVNAVKLSWKSPNLVRLQKELSGNKRKAKLYLNPNDLGQAFVAHPDNTRKKFPVYARNPVYQNGLSLETHQAIREWRSTWQEETQDKAGVRNLLGEFYRQLRKDSEEVFAEIEQKVRKRGDFRDRPTFQAEIAQDRPQEPPHARRERESRRTQPFATR